MDPALALNVVLAVTSVSAAGVAIWQALGARQDRVAADAAVEAATRAASASERQAEAAERALALHEAQMRPAPWIWSHVRGEEYAIIRNHSEPASEVSLDTFPEDTTLYWPRFVEGGIYQFGDRIEFTHFAQSMHPPHRVVVNWRVEGIDDKQSFTIVLT